MRKDAVIFAKRYEFSKLFSRSFSGDPWYFSIDFADYWGLLVSTSKNYILAIFFHSSLPPLFFKETFPILPPKSHQTSR